MIDNGVSLSAIAIRYRVRAIKDQSAGRKSKYEELKAKGCTHAEHYRDAYEWDHRALDDELRAPRPSQAGFVDNKERPPNRPGV